MSVSNKNSNQSVISIDSSITKLNKLFLKIDSLNDCYLLQKDINSLVTWANEHHLELNFLKCHSMSFYRTRDRFEYPTLSMVIL